LLNDGSEKKIIRVAKSGKGELFAKDFAVDSTVEVINGDLKIATLNTEAEVSIDVQIEYGRGYRSAEDLFDSNSVISVIPVDSIFSPVVRVNHNIEDFRVGEKTDCEKIVMEVWTSGAIPPLDAVSKSAAILKKYFSLLTEFEPEEEEGEAGEALETSAVNDILAKPITELDLSVRSFNCLKSSNINTIGELMKFDKDALMKIKNFGKKSFTEISEKLQIFGLTLEESTEGLHDGGEDDIIEDFEEGE
jgi:DNA-directed RNA polymerase subunit alpha